MKPPLGSLAIFKHGHGKEYLGIVFDQSGDRTILKLRGNEHIIFSVAPKDVHLLSEIEFSTGRDQATGKWVAIGITDDDVVYRGPLRVTIEEADEDVELCRRGEVVFQ